MRTDAIKVILEAVKAKRGDMAKLVKKSPEKVQHYPQDGIAHLGGPDPCGRIWSLPIAIPGAYR